MELDHKVFVSYQQITQPAPGREHPAAIPEPSNPGGSFLYKWESCWRKALLRFSSGLCLHLDPCRLFILYKNKNMYI